MPDLPPDWPQTKKYGDDIIREMIREHDMSAVVAAHSGRFWLRLSGSVYNTRADYERLRDILLEKFADYVQKK